MHNASYNAQIVASDLPYEALVDIGTNRHHGFLIAHRVPIVKADSAADYHDRCESEWIGFDQQAQYI